MNSKTMPERIWAADGFLTDWGEFETPGDTEYIRADLVSIPPVPVIEKGCFTVVEGLLDYQITAIIAAYESTAIAAWTEGDIYNDKYAVGFQSLHIDTDYNKGVEDRVTVLSCLSEDLIKDLSCGKTMREIPAEEIIAALSQLLQQSVRKTP